MKHTKFYSCLFAVMMLFMATATAMAQNFTIKSVSFLTPGEKGTIAVGMDNSEDIRGFQTYITLPEGVTFVQKENTEDRYVAKTAERTSTFSLIMKTSSKYESNTAAILGYAKDQDLKPGSGDIFTFEVNVDKNYTGDNKIEIFDCQISTTANVLVTPENVVGKICSTDDQVFASASVEPIKVATPQTVNVFVNFPKSVLRTFRFQVVMPQGLSIVENSVKPGEICPNHKAAYVNGFLSVSVDDIFESDLFSATEGQVFSFDVVADETFVDGSEIKFYNIESGAKVNGINGNYYAEDFAVKVVKDVTTGINGLESFSEAADGIYQLNGVRTDKMQRGVNVVVKNGKAIKVVKK